MPKMNCKITGNVQRVFFRVYAKEHADRLAITGSVQNMDDGSVQIEAQHFNEDVLKDFIEIIQEGSSLAVVKSVEVNWSEAEGELEHFRILD